MLARYTPSFVKTLLDTHTVVFAVAIAADNIGLLTNYAKRLPAKHHVIAREITVDMLFFSLAAAENNLTSASNLLYAVARILKYTHWLSAGQATFFARTMTLAYNVGEYGIGDGVMKSAINLAGGQLGCFSYAQYTQATQS
jgi:hypothetical protein